MVSHTRYQKLSMKVSLGADLLPEQGLELPGYLVGHLALVGQLAVYVFCRLWLGHTICAHVPVSRNCLSLLLARLMEGLTYCNGWFFEDMRVSSGSISDQW